MRAIAMPIIAVCLTLLCLNSPAIAKPHDVSHAASDNCFDPSDKHEIRLWDGRAPGAAGDAACSDVPYMRVFPASKPGSRPGAAILVIPGGGYDHLTNAKEQAPVGEYFSRELNVTTFVLYYRLVKADGTYRYPIPMWDGQRALKLIKARAQGYNIDPDRIGLFGFSAGGHLATMLAEHSASDFDLPAHDAVDSLSGRAGFLGLGYAVISMEPGRFGASSSRTHLLTGYTGRTLDRLDGYLSGQENVSAHMPPVFLFVGLDDARINPQNSILLNQALQSAGVLVEAHLFEHGPHGVGLAQDVPGESQWPAFFHAWLARQGLI